MTARARVRSERESTKSQHRASADPRPSFRLTPISRNNSAKTADSIQADAMKRLQHSPEGEIARIVDFPTPHAPRSDSTRTTRITKKKAAKNKIAGTWQMELGCNDAKVESRNGEAR